MLGEARYHLQASGAKAGYWVVCTAKNACRLGGEHIDRQAAEFINTQTEAKAREAAEQAEKERIAQIKKELNNIDSNVSELYPELPEGVSAQTVSELRFQYRALSTEAKEQAYNNWLYNADLDVEMENIVENLMENHNLDGFTPETVGVYNDGRTVVEFQGEMSFTPEEADQIISELSADDIESLEAYAGYEGVEGIKDQLVNGSITIRYPQTLNSGTYTNTVDLREYDLVETPTFQKKIKDQAKAYTAYAEIDYEYYTSPKYFKELAEANEITFDENGNS